MPGPDPLHELIHSLTRSEKRYFKLNAGQHKKAGKSNFIRLFDALDKMPEYDANRLRTTFKDSPLARNLPSEKKQLYQLILKIMRAYQKSGPPVLQIQQLLSEALWLEKKGLYTQFEKLLRKAKRIATESDHLQSLLEIIMIQLRATLHQKNRQMQDNVEKLVLEKEVLLTRIASSERVLSLYYRFMGRSRTGSQTRNSDIEAAEQAELERVMAIPPEELSYPAQVRRFVLAGLKAEELRDRQNAFDMFENAVNLMQTRKKYQLLPPNNHKTVLSNYLAAAAYIRRFDVFPDTLRKIRSIEAGSFDEEAEIFQNTYFFELVWKMNVGEFATAEKLVPEIESQLATYLPKVNKGRELGFYYNIAVLFFLRAKWKNALHWTNRILHDERSEHRVDLQQFARIIFLLIHFELGNADLLEYRVPATQTWTKKKGKENGLTQIILPFLSSYLVRPAEESTAALWQDLDLRLGEWIDAQKGGVPIGTEECRIWVRSKVHGITLEEALKDTL